MALIHCADLSAAAWIMASDQPWQQLVGFGPLAFPAYARLRFVPDPAYEGQSENDLDVDDDVDEALTETDPLRALLGRLTPHTRTPENCYFCLWDGWAGIRGGDGAWLLDQREGTVTKGPQIAPAFPSSVLHGPKVVVPNRAYFLFRGSISDFGDWGAADMWAGQPRLDMPDPAFIWPADHAWCVANDVDPHWAGIGAASSVIDALVADPLLDVVPADPHEDQPSYE